MYIYNKRRRRERERKRIESKIHATAQRLRVTQFLFWFKCSRRPGACGAATSCMRVLFELYCERAVYWCKIVKSVEKTTFCRYVSQI